MNRGDYVVLRLQKSCQYLAGLVSNVDVKQNVVTILDYNTKRTYRVDPNQCCILLKEVSCFQKHMLIDYTVPPDMPDMPLPSAYLFRYYGQVLPYKPNKSRLSDLEAGKDDLKLQNIYIVTLSPTVVLIMEENQEHEAEINLALQDLVPCSLYKGDIYIVQVDPENDTIRHDAFDYINFFNTSRLALDVHGDLVYGSNVRE